jgi:hypothetical protein
MHRYIIEETKEKDKSTFRAFKAPFIGAGFVYPREIVSNEGGLSCFITIEQAKEAIDWFDVNIAKTVIEHEYNPKSNN